jgi:hypothetical protein
MRYFYSDTSKSKKPSGGVCPIAVGKVWHRLAGLCALAACPNTGRSLVPLQVAVGVPGGSQIVGHAIHYGMSAHPSCVTLQVDWQNAFNTLRRGNMLVAVEQRCPALLPMVAWAYNTACNICASICTVRLNINPRWVCT